MYQDTYKGIRIVSEIFIKDHRFVSGIQIEIVEGCTWIDTDVNDFYGEGYLPQVTPKNETLILDLSNLHITSNNRFTSFSKAFERNCINI